MEKTAGLAGKRFRRCSVAVFAALIFTLIFSAFVSADTIPITLKTTKDQLNIRSEANDRSVILTVIDKQGTVLYPVEKVPNINWYKIRFANGVYGYVFGDYVVPGDSLKTSVSLFPGAALRTQPSATASVQKMCSVETELTVSAQDTSGKWYYATSFNGEKGYILKTSVKDFNVTYPVAEVPGAKVEEISLVEVNADSGKVRAKATTSSDIIATLTRGQLLSVIGEEKVGNYTWYKVKVNGGKVGYVRKDVVKAYDTSHLKGKVVVIDPGHGCLKSTEATTLDNGNTGVSGTLEKDVNLAVARYLQTYLKSVGAKVIMTRETDVGVLTLEDRSQIANNNKADIFISIHCNFSTKDKDKRGILTYYYSGSNAQSKTLAGNLQTALATELNANNLGTASDKFTVLVKSTMPSSLVELGYMSNAEDDALLKTDAYQMLCAQGLYKGVLTYFK
ncbi:MAG: N-acetylmuramoyl-L-alanine amidase [Clostridia bacterium]